MRFGSNALRAPQCLLMGAVAYMKVGMLGEEGTVLSQPRPVAGEDNSRAWLDNLLPDLQHSRPCLVQPDPLLSILAFGIVLFAAALHASWNAIIKGVGDPLNGTLLVVFGAAIVAAITLPFMTQLTAETWPYLLTSVVLQTGYFALIAAAYTAADMSQVYPLMRGLAPLIVAGAGTVALGENPGVAGWAGIALISAGVLSLAFRGSLTNGRGIALALLNAVVIAAYTLIDGHGVRLSGSPATYTLMLSLLTAVPFAFWMLVTRRTSFVVEIRRNWHLGLAGGIATAASYGLALWAMTEAPVALVSALRETSIVFGTLIAYFVLKEKIDAARVMATATIVAGAIVLRLA